MNSDQSVRTKGHSGHIIADIFEVHFPNATSVLDLTYGRGTFWKDWTQNFHLHTNDLYTPADTAHDFINYPSASYDVVVFDPPFSAKGPPSDRKRDADRYGATRDLPGAPQNIKDVGKLVTGGIHTAGTLVKRDGGLIVKLQPVVESGRLHNTVYDAEESLRINGWEVIDFIDFAPHRRPQPAGTRVAHFRSKPSRFLICRRART
jgi:hypothetical protein